MSGKWAAFLRDESRQKISFAGGDQFLHLLFWYFAMQNRFTDAKAARLRRSHRVFAGVASVENIDLAFLANWTKTERFVLRLVDLDRRAVRLSAKIEFRF